MQNFFIIYINCKLKVQIKPENIYRRNRNRNRNNLVKKKKKWRIARSSTACIVMQMKKFSFTIKYNVALSFRSLSNLGRDISARRAGEYFSDIKRSKYGLRSNYFEFGNHINYYLRSSVSLKSILNTNL